MLISSYLYALGDNESEGLRDYSASDLQRFFKALSADIASIAGRVRLAAGDSGSAMSGVKDCVYP